MLALRRILHPDFVTYHSGSSVAGNSADFMQQLDSIRHLYPGIQLAAEVVYMGNNAASVSLSLRNLHGGEFAGIGIDPVDVVGRLDLVRIERRLVVERWSSASLAGDLDAFPAYSIDLPVAIDTFVARVQHDSRSRSFRTNDQSDRAALDDRSIGRGFPGRDGSGEISQP